MTLVSRLAQRTEHGGMSGHCGLLYLGTVNTVLEKDLSADTVSTM